MRNAKKRPKSSNQELEQYLEFFKEADKTNWWKDASQHGDRMKNVHNRINLQIRSAINYMLRKGKDYETVDYWKDILGFGPKELKEHLEKLFKKDMTWNNRGKQGWVIGHVKPLSIYQFTSITDKDVKKAWGLDNLVPEWFNVTVGKSVKAKKLSVQPKKRKTARKQREI